MNYTRSKMKCSKRSAASSRDRKKWRITEIKKNIRKKKEKGKGRQKEENKNDRREQRMNQPIEKKRTNSMWTSIITYRRVKCEKIRIFTPNCV